MVKINRLKNILFTFALLTFSIQCTHDGKSNFHSDSAVSGSVRNTLYPLEKLNGLKLKIDFEKKSFNIQNIFWMSYFASLQYSHFSTVASQLEALGFGNPGEGRFYLKRWYELRLARISAGVKDVDDTWDNEEERALKLEELKKRFKVDFPKEKEFKLKSIVDLEKEILGVHNDGRKISFISGKFFFDKEKKTPGTTQLFYAEHRSLPFAVLVFRGTEPSEKLDVAADLLVKHAAIPANPGKMMAGFMAAYGEVDGEVLDLLKLRESKNPKLRLLVAGHSLGGALTTAFSARFLDLQNRGSFKDMKLAGVYTLGSPRVGNDLFAARYDLWFYRKEVPVFRIRNYRDLVTGIPFGAPATSGFWHVGSLVYYDSKGNLHRGTAEDGWLGIENNSDIKEAFPNRIKDHDVGTYVELARKALTLESDSQNTSKTLQMKQKCMDRVPMPYFENPKLRAKSISELSKEYGDTLDY